MPQKECDLAIFEVLAFIDFRSSVDQLKLILLFTISPKNLP